jgi:DNA-binding CsgD family transcriptional regulator
VVGVDGTGRTLRLEALAGATPTQWWLRVAPSDTSAGARPVAALLARQGRPVEAGDPHALGEWLASELRVANAVLVADDVHWLHPRALIALAEAAKLDAAMVVSHRPAVPSSAPDGAAAALAALDDVLATRGPVIVLGERAPDGPAEEPDEKAALGDRIRRRLTLSGADALPLARTLALAPAGAADVPGVLAEVSGLPADRLASALADVHGCGVLAAGGDHLQVVAADVLAGDLPGVERRRLQEAWALALLRHGRRADALTALRDSGAGGPAAAALFAEEAERVRSDDPMTAVAWISAAVAAGVDDARIRPVREEVALVLGQAVAPAGTGGTAASPTGPLAGRLRLAEAARAARDGRWDRAIDAVAAAPPAERVVVVPGLVALGDLGGARAVRDEVAHSPERLLADACIQGALSPSTSVPAFVEAAEAVERGPAGSVLADTPHALGSLVATASGDLPAAEHLLVRTSTPGGPGLARRHALLLAWARMRAGRYDSAVHEVRRTDRPADARDVLLGAALEVGLARRAGDIARLRDAWTRAEPVLLRAVVDLFVLEPVEELVVAAARLREHRRVPASVDALERIVAGLGRPPAWAAALAWLRLQVAVAGDDDPGVVLAAEELAAIDVPPGRPAALREAGETWAQIMGPAAGSTVDVGRVHSAAAGLAAAGLPWEGSRLAGQSAIRTTDASAARRLLEQARELATDVAGAPASASGLTERELEIARLVIDGRTHKEIGAQLYVAPKTVEHHVARIRTKVGASTRAELLATLREVVGG